MNTIRELKQQEKYKSMLKRKNKEKKIYKDKNASLQLENQRLYIALRNKDKENKQLKDNWNMLKEHLKNRYDNGTESISYRQVFMEIREAMQALEIAQELKGSDKE